MINSNGQIVNPIIDAEQSLRTRRQLLMSAAAAIGALATSSAPLCAAETYPSKPVILVVPFPAGSTTDLLARIFGKHLSDRLGQQVIIDNRSGAGGVIGTETVARAAPDGYTLLMGTIGTHAINVSVYPKLPYRPIDDFTPIAEFGTAPNVLVVNPSVPVKTLAELVGYVKARPGKINYASSGTGTSGHLSGALFGAREKLEIVHVPYRGGAQAITDLLKGEVSFMFYHYLPLLPHIRAGTLRPLAMTSAARIEALPDVPTMAEAGLPDFEVSAWFAVYAPAHLPPPIAGRLQTEIATIIHSPEVKANLIAQGIDPVSGTPEELVGLMKTEIVRWAQAVELAGARLQ